ncbi:CYFA0S04e00430g1_1 [Cyberlindnera fabianii]|uniref:CYFA0S04e00430g1_1 n=1 Tax=Cyberlindnera fabianii TaxID=36022 RepID=A0A061AYU4_CYBFA|nr:CYFA0S04e00430g1_1 [Cyberlindnera fabianii]
MPNHAVFSSMGMFIIDEIHFPQDSGRDSHYNVIGGGGTYGALGARIITTHTRAQRVGWIIDKGSDFPEEVERYLRTWNTGAVWRDTPERLTTRGWNLYGDRDFRAFKYLSPKKRIEVDDLLEYDQLLNSDSYHLICSPQRCMQILGSLKKHRTESAPIIVWEPVPDICLPENLDDTLAILNTVNVLTPNAEEAARFFGLPEPSTKPELEALAAKFINHITSQTEFGTGGGIVLRCGALGSYTLTSNGNAFWMPAYHTDGVIDPTGGGNTFIGAFTTGLVLSRGDWIVASACGNIGAGAAIEQIGMPKFDRETDMWNGKSLQMRVEEYVDRCEGTIDAEKLLASLGVDPTLT